MSGKPVIHEFIVVEGRDDTTAINRSVIADTIETNGSALSQETIEKLDMRKNFAALLFLQIQIFQVKKSENKLTQRYQAVNTLLSIAKMLYQKLVAALEWNMPVALIFVKH